MHETISARLCPYPGLRPFVETESHLFFGREGQTQELLTRLERRRHLAVLGTSGSGKSSLVYAGLVPALRGDYCVNERSRWRIVSFRPKGDPLGNLALTLNQVHELSGCEREQLHQSSMALVKALTASIAEKRWDEDTNLLIVVDQFEELFRYSTSTSAQSWDERASFVKLLIEGSRAPNLPLYVVLTMRSEYLGDCAQFRDLPETINEGQYLIPRLTRENWRAAIEGPLRLMGVQVSPMLMQRLLNDVTTIEEAGAKENSRGEEADALPLLQHALNRTWHAFEADRSQNPSASQLLLRHYTMVGGIEEALSRHLDEAWECGRANLGKDAADRMTARVFQRLRARDLKGREARDPVAFGELVDIVAAPAADVEAVLNCFRDADRPFLTPRLAVKELATAPDAPADAERLQPGTEIDITHECLLRRWAQLKAVWVPQEEDNRRMYRRLAQFLDEQELVTGDWLRIASNWWERAQPTEAWAKRYDPRFTQICDWFETSKKRAADEGRQVARRAATVRWLKSAIGVFCIAAVVAGFFIYSQVMARRASTHNWQLAMTQLLAAKAQMAFLDPLVARRTSAMLAAVSLKYSASLQVPPPSESRSVLASTLPWIPRGLPPLHANQAVNVVAGSDDGKLLVAVGRDGEVIVERDGEPTRRFAAIPSVTDLTLSRDSQFIVLTGGKSRTEVEVWDLATGSRATHVSCPDGVTGAGILNPDSSLLLVPCDDAIRQWNRKAWNVPDATGSVVRLVGNSLNPIVAVAFDAEGGHLAVAGEQATGVEDFVNVHEVLTGKVVRTYRIGTTADVNMIRFLAEGGIAAADTSGVVRVWQQRFDVAVTAPAQQRAHLSADPPVLLAHGRPLAALVPSRDGRLLLTVTDDGTVRLWDSGGDEQWRTTSGGRAITAAFDWKKCRLVIADGGQQVTQLTLWEPSDRQIVPAVGPSATRRGIAGDAFYQLRSPREVVVLNPDASSTSIAVENASAVAFSEDGRRLAVLRGRRELAVYAADAQNRFSVEGAIPLGFAADMEEGPTRVALLAFSPNGKFVVVSVVPSFAYRGGPALTLLYDVERRTSENVQISPIPVRTLGPVTADGHVILRDSKGGLLDWDLRSNGRREIDTPADTKSGGTPVASHDGSLLATYWSTAGSQANTGGNELRLLRWSDLSVARSWRYEGSISRLAFSPDDRYLVAAGADAPVRVWDTKTGEEAARIQSPEVASQLKFSEDGRRVIIVGKSMLWRFFWSDADLLKELCERKAENLTIAEWDKYIDKQYRENLSSYRCVCPPCQ
jgi:WD40 repeat protein